MTDKDRVKSIYPKAIDHHQFYAANPFWEIIIPTSTKQTNNWPYHATRWNVLGIGTENGDAWERAWEYCQREMVSKLEA